MEDLRKRKWLSSGNKGKGFLFTIRVQCYTVYYFLLLLYNTAFCFKTLLSCAVFHFSADRHHLSQRRVYLAFEDLLETFLFDKVVMKPSEIFLFFNKMKQW